MLDAARPPADDDLGPGDRLGRFELGERLGEGGMGRVFRAHDPELQRLVAVKVLRPEVVSGPAAAEVAEARLRREAQAMARLTHPNVIAVHEVGSAAGRVFIVMEMVAGDTLRRWLEREPRGVGEIVAMFVQAGAGLVAAHDAGLVHRDFKPENVLVGDDGRARVTDFGLVGHTGDAADPDRSSDGGPLAMALTHTGAVLGTPTYMSPEQHLGGEVTARTDQFSFCVALYEALWRRPPYSATTYRALRAAVTDGVPATPPSRPRVPARLRRAILRGLAREPSARFPTMAALLAELRSGARAGRGGWWAVGAALAGGALAIGAVVRSGAGARAGAVATAATGGGGAVVDGGAVASASAPVAVTDLGGCSEGPAFIDDATVVFSRSLGGSQHLYALSLAGGEPRVLTGAPGNQWKAEPGPDPGGFTYVDAGERATTIKRRDRDGTLVPQPSPARFATDTGAIPTVLGLIYTTPDQGRLRVLDAGGADRELLVLPGDRLVNRLAASRDGRWLAVDTARTSGVCLVDLTAATPTLACRAVDGMMGGTWFDATGASYYHATNAGVWRFDRGASAPTLIAPGVVPGESIAVSADDRTLIYSDCTRRTRLLDLGGARPLELAAGRIQGAAIGAGDRIVFKRQSRGGSVLELREPDGGLHEITALDDGLPVNPAWDRAGRRVAFRLVGKGIHVVDVGAGAAAPLVRVSASNADIEPLFLDDDRVIFSRFGDDQQPSVWLVDAAGAAPRRVLSERMAWDVDRANGQVLVSNSGFTALWWWDPLTGVERPATALAALAKRGFSSVSIALDGSAVALVVAKTEAWRVPLTGGRASKVFETGESYDELDRPVILASGQVVVTAAYWAGELYRVDLPPR